LTALPPLRKLYGTPGAASLSRVADHLTLFYIKWIMVHPEYRGAS
tara:strand:- start:2869 stop:3003 length:135 start_codon:yes stop_codon:yes gene_type:complete